MLPTLVAVAHAGVDCSFEEADYYTLRDRLREMAQVEGRTVAVAAAGPRCQSAIDAVVSNDPFLRVARVSGPTPDHPCVAVVAPSPAGWDLELEGTCRSDPDTREVATAVGNSAQTAQLRSVKTRRDHMVSIGAWLPYGVTGRWNQDVGKGFSVLADFGWHPPRLWSDPFDLPQGTGPANRTTSSMRAMLGVDLTQDGLVGTYFGVRSGVEGSTPAEGGPTPQLGLVSFVGGHKWSWDNHSALQLGGGVLAEMPLGHGPLPTILSPVAELRLGFTNR
ncbi:MAG: hypothetical protein ABMA64_19490 [Myxococcota bacterium]